MFIKENAVKRTRKPHQCEFCLRQIDIGESAVKYFCADGSDAHSYYLCGWCEENIREFLSHYDDYEFSRGDLHDYVNDALYDRKCAKCKCEALDWQTDTKNEKIKMECRGCWVTWEIKLDIDEIKPCRD